MKRTVNGLVLLGLGALIAAGVAWWMLREDPETATPDAVEESPQVLMMGTGGVEKSIVERLGARYGREVVAECPEEVEQTVGTEFECDVFFADDTETRTVAQVTMTGGGGAFEWTTENAPDEEPTTDTE